MPPYLFSLLYTLYISSRANPRFCEIVERLPQTSSLGSAASKELDHCTRAAHVSLLKPEYGSNPNAFSQYGGSEVT